MADGFDNEKINYVELPSADFAKTKTFFQRVFGWQFTDYGDAYMAFSRESAGLDGGFYRSEQQAVYANGAPLVVFYSHSLAQTQCKIEQAGGKIVVPVFTFPGGSRFHFTDPTGNEYAVWSEQNE